MSNTLSWTGESVQLKPEPFPLCLLFLSLYCLFLGAEVGAGGTWSSLNLSCTFGFLNRFSKLLIDGHLLAFLMVISVLIITHELNSDFLKQGT